MNKLHYEVRYEVELEHSLHHIHFTLFKKKNRMEMKIP